MRGSSVAFLLVAYRHAEPGKLNLNQGYSYVKLFRAKR
jgi:hypothetical protein